MAGFSFILPETFWKQVWFIKQEEYQQMLQRRQLYGWGFWLLAIIMLLAVVGWFRKRCWGWFLTVGIFFVNGISDGIRLITGSYVEGGIGVCVTALIIYYQFRPSVKKIFC